jgi:hypothetical protein
MIKVLKPTKQFWNYKILNHEKEKREHPRPQFQTIIQPAFLYAPLLLLITLKKSSVIFFTPPGLR